MRARATAFGLGLAACLAAGPVLPQEILAPVEMQQRALLAVTEGRDADALALSTALLQRDPDAPLPRLVASRAARNLGRYDLAHDHARAAWNSAEAEEDRYRSALLVAQALASRNDKLRAQFWLRRAAEIAPTEAQKERAVRDLRHVRDSTPTSVRLSFSVAPTSNANGGAAQDVVTLFGLPIVLSGSALALSGTRIATGIDVAHVLSSTQTARTTATMALSHQTYRLSDEAKALAPAAKGSDFALTSVDLGLSRDISAGAGKGYWTVTGELGSTWYGGDPLSRAARLSLGRTWRTDGGILFEASAGLEASKRLQGASATPVSLGLSLNAGKQVPGGILRLGLDATESRSEAMSYDYISSSISAGYTLDDPLLRPMAGGVALSLSASVGVTEFDATPYKAGGRRDQVVQGAVTAAFPGLDYYGFAPSVTVEGSRRASDVDLFDTKRLGVSLGVVSTF